MDRSSKRGPAPLAEVDKRSHCVSSRMSLSELAWLDDNRGAHRRGEYLRIAAMDKIPPTIPAINVEAWSTLAKAAGNLATLATAMRSGTYIDMGDINAQLKEFRMALIGAKI